MKYLFIAQHKMPIQLHCNARLWVLVATVITRIRRNWERRLIHYVRKMLEWVEDFARSSGYTHGSRRMKKH